LNEQLEQSAATVQSPTIQQDVTCPLCNYNLRGLSEPRCPECGFTFDWREIRDVTRRKHPHLFEHHPDRNLWSFCKTLLGGLNPWGFWRRLHPAQPPNLTRLTIYRWVMKAVAAVPLVITGLWLLMMSADWPVDDWPRQSMFFHTDPFAGQSASLISELVGPLLHTRLYIFILIMTLFLLALPEMSTAALLTYVSSMRQKKIQKHHVDRCVAYSYDVLLWPIAGMILLGVLILFFNIRITSWQPWLLSWCLLLLLPGVWLLMSIKLIFCLSMLLADATRGGGRGGGAGDRGAGHDGCDFVYEGADRGVLTCQSTPAATLLYNPSHAANDHMGRRGDEAARPNEAASRTNLHRDQR
jgi:hypothetical protein